MNRVRRAFQLTLADRPERRAECESCILRRLQTHGGIYDAQVLRQGEQVTIDLEYDPDVLTLAELERELARAEACLCPDVVCLVVPARGIDSPASEQLVNTELGKLPGVVATASYASQSLRLEFDRRQCSSAHIERRLAELGIDADLGQARELGISQPPHAATQMPQPKPPASNGWRWLGALVDNRELGLAVLAGLLLAPGFAVHEFNGPTWLRMVLVALSYIAAGRYTGLEAWHTIRHFQFNIDVLMFAAAFGAASIGYPEEGGLLLFLFALGNAGEHMALERARNAIRALSHLAPDRATVRDAQQGGERVVAVEQVRLDEEVIVRPFERVPVDGQVIEGASAVDQAPITGESIPVEKATGDAVFAGTINGEGRMVVRVTRLATQSTLAKIIKLVEEAQTTKSPTQVFTDRVEKWYVPIVIILTAGLICVPPLLGLGHHRGPGVGLWAGWFYQAMAFLTAASPCALAIGTPAAVLCGIARAARMGVLMKGGAHLENLGRVQAIAFDKTGTLTTGKPTVTDVVPLNGTDPGRLLALAAAIERESNHPLARAIVAEAELRMCLMVRAEEIQQIPGQGMRGRVGGKRIAAGHLGLLPETQRNSAALLGYVDDLTRAGKTIVAIAVEGQCLGLIALSDRPRDNAPQALAQLRRIGVRRVIMLTGDHRQAAATIGRQVGVDEVFAELLPEEKLGLIRRQIEQWGPVAMVGDGVNDAPALAYASVGIAMGGAGADVAMETADVVLMSSDLAKLPEAIGLSRFSRGVIGQNLLIALGVIGVMAPVAGLGFAPLGLAVLLHEGSTVVVVVNALRLLAYHRVRAPRAAGVEAPGALPAVLAPDRNGQSVVVRTGTAAASSSR